MALEQKKHPPPRLHADSRHNAKQLRFTKGVACHKFDSFPALSGNALAKSVGGSVAVAEGSGLKIVRLELHGFKSFKDKTVVSFSQPITAVVGSNGCGKSNVVDALYWVMGDMSPKHLRGQAMTDVIFSGSRDAASTWPK
jgi:hypothetical protein